MFARRTPYRAPERRTASPYGTTSSAVTAPKAAAAAATKRRSEAEVDEFTGIAPAHERQNEQHGGGRPPRPPRQAPRHTAARQQQPGDDAERADDHVRRGV